MVSKDQLIKERTWWSNPVAKIIITSLVVLTVLISFGYIVNKNYNNNSMNNVVKKENGLVIEDIVVGTGQEINTGDTANFHYEGFLIDGTKFDSSRDRGEPFEVPVGSGMVIKGWDEGLVGMKVGGKRKLTIPPELAYGSREIPGLIPANSILIFEVEAVSVQN